MTHALGLDVATVRNYLSILETIFVIERLSAYAPSQLTRATAAPKITFVDSGLATHLAGGLNTGSMAGNLLENFVLGELGRQLTWCEPVVQLFHYRDRDQHKVDAVLEDLSGRVVGIEVKTALTVRPDDFRGLRVLRDKLGDRFLAGFVLYCGQDRLSSEAVSAASPFRPSGRRHPESRPDCMHAANVIAHSASITRTILPLTRQQRQSHPQTNRRPGPDQPASLGRALTQQVGRTPAQYADS